jgi:hypothetical protein
VCADDARRRRRRDGSGEEPTGDTAIDRVGAQSDAHELLTGDHTVLAVCDLSQSRLRFAAHIAVK